MSSFMFHNNTASLNDLFYESHASVLKMVAMELGASEKIPELMEKILGNKLKIKAPKDPNKPKGQRQHLCITANSIVLVF